MFVVLLKFSDNKAQAGQHMDGHNAWIKQGFDDGVFLVVGSMETHAGGAIIAQDKSLEAIQARVALDPFVVESVVEAEVIQISPKKMDDRLQSILG